MGGLGSGRRGGSGRTTVEACRLIDVNRLRKKGCLRAGWCGAWTWTRDGEQVASITLHAEAGRLHLAYRVRAGGGEWQDVGETVPVVRVPCPFGGTKPLFTCPGAVRGIPCGRRVAKLYLAGRYFLCRHCHGLAYESQNARRWHRALRRASKTRERLGGDGTLAAPLPDKPKGMWWRTYRRLCERAVEAEVRVDEMFVVETAPLFRRADRLSGKSGSRR